MREPKSLNPNAAFTSALQQSKKSQTINDPVGWVDLALPHIHVWSKQQEILNALTQHKRVAVRSCHDSGKSFIASIAAARWLDVHPAGSARVVTTAPTAMQVKGILWVELNQLKAQADLPGRMNQTEWWIGSYLAGVGRKPSDYNPSAFQGLHARFMLIIIDEASGVPNALVDAAETLATNANARILMIGNPDDPNSLFAAIHNDPMKYGYHTIRISAWDTPNFTDEANQPGFPIELSENLLSPEWVEQRRAAWGVDHPFWLSKVEAEFPPVDTLSVIKLHDLIKCRIPYGERPNIADPASDDAIPHPAQATPNTTIHGNLSSPGKHRSTERVLGVDVAGSDQGDETICRLMLPGNRPTSEWKTRSSDPKEVSDFIVRSILESMPSTVVVDVIGVGWGIMGMVKGHDAIEALPISIRPSFIGFNSANAAHDKMYGNARAELWWNARLLFQNGHVDTSMADSQMELEAQLLQPRYHITKGKIFVEAKEDIRARIGRSPDSADAFLYSLLPAIRSSTITMVPTTSQPQIMQRHSLPRMNQSTRLVRQR